MRQIARRSRKDTVSSAEPPADGRGPWRAALYIGPSAGGERGDSPESQRQIMEAHLAAYPDIEIAGIYADGVSGQTFSPGGFQALLADIESGKINCVVVQNRSRFGGDLIDAGFYINRYFPLHHVRFLAASDHYDSENRKSREESRPVTASRSRYRSRNRKGSPEFAADISRIVRTQLRQYREDGEYTGSFARYGYRKDPENCHKLLVNEDTAPVVRQMFAWYGEGVSINEITRRLNEAGVVTPGQYLAKTGQASHPRLTGDGKWKTRIVARILSDEIYTGDLVQGKTRIEEHKLVPVPEEEWVIVRDVHEPIVPRELFDRVQKMRAQTAATRASYDRTSYSDNILRGRIFCGCCGRNMERQRIRDRYRYYCISNVRIEKGFCDGKGSVPEDIIFEEILRLLRQEAETVLGNRSLLQRPDGALARRNAQAQERLRLLREEQDTNQRSLSSLKENHAAGGLAADEYRRKKAGYERRILQIMTETQTLEKEQRDLDRQLERYLSLADQLEAVKENPTLTAQLVKQLIERVTVDGADDISVHFRFEKGFERLLAVMSNE